MPDSFSESGSPKLLLLISYDASKWDLEKTVAVECGGKGFGKEDFAPIATKDRRRPQPYFRSPY